MIARAFHLFMILAIAASVAACSENEPAKMSASNRDQAPAAGDWPTYGGQPSATHYSALDQINLGNVHRLAVAWTYHTGELSDGSGGVDATAYEVTPIFANNRLYLCTPFNHIVALDPATGQAVWRFDPKKPLSGTMFGSHYCRGVSYWAAETAAEREKFCGKRVLEGTGNGWLVAVDADTGKPCGDFGDHGKVDLTQLDYKGEGLLASTSPPAIYKDVVIIGGTIQDNKWKNALDGIVRGIDVRSGKELWHWNPIPEPLSDRTGAANTWAPMSVDQDRGWVFLPTGSPSYDVYGANRADPIPFGNAVVALEALTGKVVWSFQAVHHDLWDYDLPAAPTLVMVKRDGKKVPAVVQATKMGFVFVLDRLTGQPLFPVEERPVPPSDVPGEHASPTQPFPLLPAAVTSQSLTAEDAWGVMFFDKKQCRDRLKGLRNEGIYTPPSVQGSILHPSFLGGTNWGGIAYDEASGLAVLNSSNMVSAITLVPRADYDPQKHNKSDVQVFDMQGSPYILLREVLLSFLGAPCNPPPWGRLTAIDMNSGKTRWQVPFGRVEFGGLIKTSAAWGSPNQGGPIITKGGLIFIGASLDNALRAFDLQTGREVWSGDLPAPATATPMTYHYGPDNRQYVVISAGGHEGFRTDISDSIVAFTLKD